ncbi:MAG: helix-hairpin-helix domain-containing protein, partial [Thermodesulfobacteriota bacterium]
LERQKVVSHRGADQDVFALARGGETVLLQALFVRGGRLVNSLDYTFTDCGLSDKEIISSFLTQFYSGGRVIPREVLLPVRPDDSALIEEWLSEKAGRAVKLHAPVRGEKRELLSMALENACESLQKKEQASLAKSKDLEELARRLRMKTPPLWIEAFDISNTSGSLGVGAMVSFRDGEPDKAGYRLFRIKGVSGQDDYAMMEEVMRRRYLHAGRDNEGELPDLMLIDGGKGQLGVAVKVMAELGLDGAISLAALAKERPAAPGSKLAGDGHEGQGKKYERVFLPGRRNAIMLRQGSRADLLLCRIRDEVHRTAIGYQRKLRNKKMFNSPLDEVAGIGVKRKKQLLKKFGSLQKLIDASVEEICRVPGLTKSMAEAIKGLKIS